MATTGLGVTIVTFAPIINNTIILKITLLNCTFPLRNLFFLVIKKLIAVTILPVSVSIGG